MMTNKEDQEIGSIRTGTQDDVYVAPPVEEKRLPPIADIVVPKTATKSAMIRWLCAMGYSVKEISASTGIVYQMVRNISLSQPKRAAREDLPPLVIEYREQEDLITAAMDGALDAAMASQRKERKKAEKVQRRIDAELRGDLIAADAADAADAAERDE
jgi:hypothetical protein